MKKIFIAILLIATLLVSLVSCGKKSLSLTDCANEVISIMSLMTKSNEYKALYNLPAVYAEALSELSDGDYGKADAVYEIKVPQDALLDPGIDTSSLSGELKDYISSMVHTAFATKINQASGVAALAVSAAFSAQKTFSNVNISENTIYLFTFENGYPIAVAFIAGEGGSVRACGNFIIGDKLATEGEDAISTSLADIGIAEVTVTKVK